MGRCAGLGGEPSLGRVSDVALVALGVLLGPAIDVPTRPDEGGSFLIDDSPLGVFALNEGGLWVGLGLGTALGARVAWQQRHA